MIKGSAIASRLIHLVLDPLPLTVRAGPNRGVKWFVGAGVHSCWLGTYESGKQIASAKVIRRGMTLYDVGAHSGFSDAADPHGDRPGGARLMLSLRRVAIFK